MAKSGAKRCDYILKQFKLISFQFKTTIHCVKAGAKVLFDQASAAVQAASPARVLWSKKGSRSFNLNFNRTICISLILIFPNQFDEILGTFLRFRGCENKNPRYRKAKLSRSEARRSKIKKKSYVTLKIRHKSVQ